MKRIADDHSQSMQRVRVGMIGLAAVILLIGLASIIFSGIREQRASRAAGGGDAAVVANESDEPLADMGVAPGAATVAANDTPSNVAGR